MSTGTRYHLRMLACVGRVSLLVSSVIACAASPSPDGDGGTDGSSGTTAAETSTTVAPTTSTTAGSATTTTESATGDSSESGDPTGDTVTPTPDDCITDVAAGHHTFECDGITFEVEVPEACLQAPCGMVFDVHGYTMSAQMEDANTNMRALGREHGYIVVQPSANPAPPGASWTPDIDDPKVFDFMQRTAAAWDVDPNRWHFTGFSQGGFMSWRFICDHADVLASVAPAAACGDGAAFPDCSFEGEEVPSEPVSIMFMHGTDDALVNYACAEPRVAAAVAHYGLGEAETVDEGEGFRWTRHSGDGVVLEFLSHDYAASNVIIRGHCYPGSTDPGDAPGQLFPFGCEGENGFVWGEVAMQFFIDHPKG